MGWQVGLAYVVNMHSALSRTSLYHLPFFNFIVFIQHYFEDPFLLTGYRRQEMEDRIHETGDRSRERVL